MRKEECIKLLDFLLDLNKGVVPYNVLDDCPNNGSYDFKLSNLVGQIDVDNIVMCGQSFGAATALLTLASRKEFKYVFFMCFS